MKKIISLFQRNYEGNRQVRDEVVPGAEWVINGEGVATRKYDGTACMIQNGELFLRYDAKKGRTPPEGFIPAQESADEATGHFPGWIPADVDNPAHKWHIKAFESAPMDTPDGTYEICGPHFQGNPEKLPGDCLVRHGIEKLPDCPRTFDELKEWLKDKSACNQRHRDNAVG